MNIETTSADGVAKDKIYPLDVDRSLRKLQTIKANVIWWDSASTALQLLNNGECSMAMMWTGRVHDAIEKQGLPLDFTWDGGLLTSAYFAVPKGATDKKVGFAAIAMWIKDQAAQIDYVNAHGTATAANGDTYDVVAQPPKGGRSEWTATPAQVTIEKMLRDMINAQNTSKVKTLAVTKQGPGAYTGTATLENVTFHSNNGFQIFTGNGALLRCHHCTIVAEQLGGNEEVRASDSIALFESSMVAGECGMLAGGIVGSEGGNVESPGDSCFFTLASDRDEEADPGLSAIGDHGGETRTFDLLTGSPAIGLVEDEACAGHDQRGVARSPHPFQTCDSGAVERVALNMR